MKLKKEKKNFELTVTRVIPWSTTTHYNFSRRAFLRSTRTSRFDTYTERFFPCYQFCTHFITSFPSCSGGLPPYIPLSSRESEVQFCISRLIRIDEDMLMARDSVSDNM